MIHKSFGTEEFSPELSVAGSLARLKCYCRDETPGESEYPALLIFPGGGYAVQSMAEAEPAALAFLAHGFQTFVLDYSLAPKKYPWQLLEAAAAIAFIRRRSGDFHVDDRRVAVCGFSAGGHLAGCLANLWEEEFLSGALGVESGKIRPDAAVLCYPVISGRFGGMSHRNLGVSDEENPELSLERSVSQNTPACFIWHTADDPMVSVEHSLLFAKAMQESSRPFELHIFHKGPHIMSVCTSDSAISSDRVDPHVGKWVTLASEFLKEVMR